MVVTSYPAQRSVPVQPRLRPPDLNNAARFVRVDKIPIIDTLERTYYKQGSNGKRIKIEESVDKKQLINILENSRHRAENGNYGIVFVGHTNDEGAEIDQPPLVGYLDNYQLGEHNGRPAIVADMYLDREDCDPSRTLRQFPRRSAEVISISKPNGYIDSVALLKRTPERDLGLVTSHYRKKADIYRFDCPGENSKMSLAATLVAHQAKQDHAKKKVDVVKQTAKLLVDLVSSCVDSNMEESDDDAGGGGTGPGESLDNSGDKTMDPNDNSITDDPSEEEPMAAKTSRHRKHIEPDPSDSSEPSYPSPSGEEPKDDSSYSSSSSSSGEEPPAKKRPEPSRMDPEPSRMCMDSKKSKMEAGGGAGFASPTTTPPAMNDPSRESKVKTKTSRMSRERDRMRHDDERISVSRFQRELEKRDETIGKLMARLDAKDQETRDAIIERKLIQLQAEGFEIDRAEEMSRFRKLLKVGYLEDDDDVDLEISRMRKTARQSPVGQQLIPSFSGDLGGSTVERPVNPMTLMNPLPEESDSRYEGPIIGAHIARFAQDNDIVADKRGRELDFGKSIISRYQAEKGTKTRH